MPIYEYQCPECSCEQEVILPFSEANVVQMCSQCGKPTERIMSCPSSYSASVLTGRDKVLKTLNKEEGGYSLPGGGMHRARYERAFARGLDQTRPVIGKGC